MLVVSEFSKQKPISEIAAVLPRIFVGGYGLKLSAGDVSAWYYPDGIHLSYGRHIQHSRAAQIISWKDAALRTGQLLEEGHYASNTELAEALYHEQSVLADRLVLASRDAVDGYMPTIRSIKGVFPDQLDSVIELLRSPDSLETISKEFAEFYAGYKAGEPVSRFKIYTIDQIASGLIDLTLPRREYATEWTLVPQPAGFITEDEIDTLFVSGPPMSGGKQRVFDYFSQHHSPKEEIVFLKNEYGISGHNNALPGSFRSDVMFDGKGMTLKKPGCARVEMRWNQIHDRIRNLVRKDSYLSVEEAEKRRARHSSEEELFDEVPNLSEETQGPNDSEQSLPEDAPINAEEAAASPTPEAPEPEAPMEEESEFKEEPVHESSPQLAVLGAAQEAEYRAIREQYDSTILVGFEQNGYFEFYGDDAQKVSDALGSHILTKSIEGGDTIPVTGFPAESWVAKGKKIWSHGNSLVLMGANEDGSHYRFHEYTGSEYLPIGQRLEIDNRQFVIDSVDYHTGKVTLQDDSFRAGTGFPIFRVESTDFVRSYLEDWMDSHPAYTIETVETIPAEENHLPFDVVIQTLKTPSKAVEPELPPKPVAPAVNYHITDDNLGVGGAKQKFARNYAAICLLHELERSGAQADPDQQEVLGQYVGWGGLADAFDDTKPEWAFEYAQLKAELTDEEYKAARASTLNAHYTSPTIIRAMYQAIESMGFQTGNILEPAMGVGNFFGMLPEGMQHSRLYGVELDSLSGRIAKQLYPNAHITISGFEQTCEKDFYDLAIGNVPFGQYRVNDLAFNKVRTGQVRVLMGITFKMGAGMNVQDRLIALHDLDCPWRPGDLEQRSGRIIRQGNMNKQVHIYRYVTEGTFDSYLWQTVENKQKFISQIMTSKSPVRSCEDVDETALSFAEIKALCAGNPAIKEKMDLDFEVARLKVLKADHQSQQFRMEDNLLKYYPEQIRKLQGIIAGLEADIQTADAHPHPEEGFAGMTFNNKVLSDKEKAGVSLLEASKQATGYDPLQIGSYRGFEMRATLENFGKDHVLTLTGQLSHRVTLGNDARGKYASVKGKDQQRFVRFHSLGEGYSEEDIQAVIAGEKKHRARIKSPLAKEDRVFNLLLVIDDKIRAKGPGYQQWATNYNLKQMAKTRIFLKEHNINSMDELREKANSTSADFDRIDKELKSAEQRLVEIAALKKHIINYAKTREAYVQYRKAGYSKAFFEAHREEITLHKAAKDAFQKMGVSKLPKVKELSEEYATVLEQKKSLYAQYRLAREEMREYQKALHNTEVFFDLSNNVELETKRERDSTTVSKNQQNEH